MPSLVDIYNLGYDFIVNPSWKKGILLLIIFIVGLCIINYRSRSEERNIKKQKKEVLLALIANGFTLKSMDHLKKITELCKNNNAKLFHNYVSLNRPALKFFLEYPLIYKNITQGNIIFENKDLKRSNDIFGAIYWLGIHTSDLIGKNVMDSLDTALLITNEGREDLKRAGFYFEELIDKAICVDDHIDKLEMNKEFKKYISSKKIFKE